MSQPQTNASSTSSRPAPRRPGHFGGLVLLLAIAAASLIAIQQSTPVVAGVLALTLGAVSFLAGSRFYRRNPSNLSEERFRRVFASAATGIAITDWSGRFQQCNAAYCALVGYTEDELRQLEFPQIVHPEDQTENAAGIARLKAGAISIFEVENRYVRKDGNPVWVKKFISTLHDNAGAPVGIMALVADISERKLAEFNSQFLLELDRVLAQTTEADSVPAQAVELVGRYLGAQLCAVCEIDVTEQAISFDLVWPSSEVVKATSLAGALTPPISAKLQAGEPVAIDSASSPDELAFAARCSSPDASSFALISYPASAAAIPALLVNRSIRRHWLAAELLLLREVIARLWPAIDRARAAAALRSSEERFRGTFENAAVGMAHVAVDGRWLRVNERLCEIVGYTRAELLERSFGDITHPDDLELDWAHARALLAGKIPSYSMEKRYLRPRGDSVWVNLTASVQRGRSGQPEYFIVVVEDIDARKRAEDALRRSELIFRRIADANIVGVGFGNDRGQVIYANDEMLRMMGRTRAECDSGQINFLECLAPENRDLIGPDLEQLAVTGKSGILEREFLHRDGQRVSFAGAAAAVALPDTNFHVTIAVDISRLRAAESALRESERRLRVALDAANAGAFEIDLDPEIRPVVTQGIKRLFGFAAEANPTLDDFAARIHPEDRAHALATLHGASSTGKSHYIEYRIIRPAAPDLWVASRGDVELDASGRPHRLVGAIIDITERKIAEGALRKSEQTLQLAQVAGRVGSFDWDIPSGIAYCSEVYFRVFGIEPRPGGTITFAEITELLHPADRGAVVAGVSAALQSDATEAAADFRSIGGDGQIRWLSYRGLITRGAAGLPLRMVGVVQDITAAKNAEAVLREREALLEAQTTELATLYRTAPVGLCQLDRELRFVRVNEALAEMTGTPISSYLCHSAADILPELYRALLPARDSMLASQEPLLNRELEIADRAHPDQHRTWLVNFHPLPDRAGEVNGIQCSVLDVTERKRAERAVQESEARFRALAEAVPELLFTTGPDGLCDFTNPSFHQYTGLNERESSGLGWVGALHQEDVPPTLEKWQQAVAAGALFEAEYRIRRHDGVYHWFIARATPLADRSGRIVKWFGAATDIEQQKRVESELRRANQDLEQFAYSASHDLQEPLRNVSLYSQLLQRRYGQKLDSDADQYLGYMTGGARRMAQLVTDLLAYARAASLGDEPQGFGDAEAVFNRVLESLRQVMQETGAIVTHDPLPAIAMKEIHIEQVLQNLLSNAIKYRQDGQPPRIHVQAIRFNEYWRFSVQDNGIGIEPEYQERIFGVFKRLHAGPAKYPGTGIGLAICQKIVERYDGRIWVDSALGHGATFYFTVPARSPDTLPTQPSPIGSVFEHQS